MKKLFGQIILSGVLCLSLYSCSGDGSVEDNNTTLQLNATAISYNSNNVWSDYLTENAKLVSQGLVFSHSANSQWQSYTGFVASRNSDAADYSTGNWLEHQFTSMTGGGFAGKGTPYLIAYWNSSEAKDVTLDNASCAITYGTGGDTFTPQSVLINNTTYGYYAMLNGTQYSKKFATGDSFKLNIYGVKANGTKTGPVTVNLADYSGGKSTLLKDWTYVMLDALGEVKGLYFQMESTDTGQWGINTPTYFALDRLTIKSTKTTLK